MVHWISNNRNQKVYEPTNLNNTTLVNTFNKHYDNIIIYALSHRDNETPRWFGPLILGAL